MASSAALICALVALPGQAADVSPLRVQTRSGGLPATTTPATKAHPVKPTVREYRVAPLPAAARAATAGRAVAKGAPMVAALTSSTRASGHAVAGVTWSGRTPEGLALAMRSKDNGVWSRWKPVPFDEDHGPNPGSAEAAQQRHGSDAYVLGEVDEVQLRVTSASGALPRGMSMALVDPGTSDGPTAAPASASQPTTASQPTASQPAASQPTTAAATASQPTTAAAITSQTRLTVDSPTPPPPIYSRAQWGADESLRDCCVEYGEVHAGFVHHTVNANGYTAAQVPAIIRGIYAYHTKSRGWKDIGYNYLVDRFGRIWEGRFGGVTLPVVGAHTLNYNENSFAASAIGNFDVVQPSAAVIDAYARLYAWKLSLHGVQPQGVQNVAGTRFNAISGHRDAASTACPGRYLYAKIPTIRSRATSYQHGFSGRDVFHSFTGASVPDVLLMDPATGQLAVSAGTGPPGFAARSALVVDFGQPDLMAPVGDVTGDGRPDLLARRADTKVAYVYPGTGPSAVGAPAYATTQFAAADLITGVGDVTGDGRPDVLARNTADGELLLYPGLGRGRFGTAVMVGSGFGSYRAITGAADFNGDGFMDFIAHGQYGALHVYHGDGTGSFPRVRPVWRTGGGLTHVSSGADVTGDGWPDVVARRADTGMTQVLPNRAGAGLSTPVDVSKHWATFTHLRLTTDISGDRKGDLLAVTPAGRMIVLKGFGQNWLAPVAAADKVLAQMDLIMVVGDWNRDGYVDAMSRHGVSRKMYLQPGRSAGGFGTSVGGWGYWSRDLIAPVGDFNGDGFADLMARDGSRAVYLYPGRGASGFGKRILMRSNLGDAAQIVSVGLWNSDGAPDVMVRDLDGQLWFYPGNGPGGLDAPTLLRSDFKGYNQLVGVGDVNRDGQPDLVARRASDGSAWLLTGIAPGTSSVGGLAVPRYVGARWSSYLLG